MILRKIATREERRTAGDMRRGQRGGHREEKTATMMATKQGSITFKRESLIKKGRFYLKRSSLIERVVFDLI